MLNRLLIAALPTALVAFPAGARTLPLAEAVRRADAVVVATVADPATDQTLVPVAGAPDFVRLQRRLRVEQVVDVRGVPAAVRKALKAGALVRVDDADGRKDLEASRKCRGREPCAMPDKDDYASDLSREPRPGQTVLVLLRHTPDGWALALDRAMDLPGKAAAVRRAR